jgi:hypothetical protein
LEEWIKLVKRGITVFILFNDAVSSSDYIVSDDRTINE